MYNSIESTIEDQLVIFLVAPTPTNESKFEAALTGLPLTCPRKFAPIFVIGCSLIGCMAVDRCSAVINDCVIVVYQRFSINGVHYH
ncbi:hypothetical protein T4E_6142 [Trichinella pseudospiralis]|uniref:Uncharacterized protein n=1 Tax=Trichinella pseudospiralis TaxID=6337 RepID=A0A0V0XDL1_TRIPS|nr:hypothetical protein T4E_6142 [Trichinella pseudospiralis]